MNLRHEVQDIATELEAWANENDLQISVFETLQIAVQIQRNKLYRQAHFEDMDGGSSNLDDYRICLQDISESFVKISDALETIAEK